ncbi:hypothetical protein F4805DRAFT_478330 [Annulohypoxylon moriforme]|nr:hypothetical protein F4805DRAFT_478330 [Annulohypoxylon moriforme]
MSEDKGVNSPNISLFVPPDLNAETIPISAFKELFTFIDYKNEEPYPIRDHPDIEKNRQVAMSTVYGFSTAATGVPTLKQPDLNAFPALSVDHSGNDNDDSDVNEDQDEEEEDDPRVIVLPGCPPAVQQFNQNNRSFTATKPRRFDRPFLGFESLCCAAIEKGLLSSIKSAKIVTDVSTLWALFITLHCRISGRRYGDHNKHEKGPWIAVEVVEGTIFMKLMNLHNCDHWSNKAATDHLKKEGTEWCHGPAAEGAWKEPQEGKTFKRVISYTFGEINMVVVDEMQALCAPHVCQALRKGLIKGPDGSE